MHVCVRYSLLFPFFWTLMLVKNKLNYPVVIYTAFISPIFEFFSNLKPEGHQRFRAVYYSWILQNFQGGKKKLLSFKNWNAGQELSDWLHQAGSCTALEQQFGCRKQKAGLTQFFISSSHWNLTTDKVWHRYLWQDIYFIYVHFFFWQAFPHDFMALVNSQEWNNCS